MKPTKLLAILFIGVLILSSCKKEEENTGKVHVIARVLNIGKVAGIKVSLNRTSNNEKIETKNTDAEGEVTFANLTPDTYFLTASYDDGTDTYSGNTIDFEVKNNETTEEQIVLIKNN